MNNKFIIFGIKNNKTLYLYKIENNKENNFILHIFTTSLKNAYIFKSMKDAQKTLKILNEKGFKILKQ